MEVIVSRRRAQKAGQGWALAGLAHGTRRGERRGRWMGVGMALNGGGGRKFVMAFCLAELPWQKLLGIIGSKQWVLRNAVAPADGRRVRL